MYSNINCEKAVAFKFFLPKQKKSTIRLLRVLFVEHKSKSFYQDLSLSGYSKSLLHRNKGNVKWNIQSQEMIAKYHKK